MSVALGILALTAGPAAGAHAATATIGSSVVSSPVVATPTITDLGGLGGATSIAYGVNASGHVVGSADIASGPPHAFLYDGSTLHDLGTLGGGTNDFSSALGVNDSDQVVGLSSISGIHGPRHPFLYDGGTLHDLGLPPGSSNLIEATGINDSGQIAGFDVFSHAFLHDSAGFHDLGTLGGIHSAAFGINASGQVVGGANTADSTTDAFIDDSSGMHDLGRLAGNYVVSYGRAINASGQVAGYASDSKGASRAFTYDSGAWHDLGALGRATSAAFGINASGQVVGQADTASGQSHAFLYDGCGMHDLNGLLPSDAGWVLTDALGLNDSGQIVGQGSHNGQSHAYLLTPGLHVTCGAPASAQAGGGDLPLTLTGTGFADGATVQWNGQPLPTTYVSPTQLSAVVPAADIANAGTDNLTVVSPDGSAVSAPSPFFVTAANAPVTASGSGTSTTTTGSALASTGATNATATGSGTVSVAQYGADPVAAPLPAGTAAYFDVYTAPGSAFNTVTVTRCNVPAANHTLYWWDATAGVWTLVAPQSYDANTMCVTAQLDAGSSPTIAQLSGDYFGVGAPVSANGQSDGSATPELGSGELLSLGLLPIGLALLYRRRRRRRTQQPPR